MLLLIVFGGHSYAQTKPRKMGIGVRYGLNIGSVYFKDENNKEYVASNHYEDEVDVNKTRDFRYPLHFQFNEDLLNNYVFTTWTAHFDTLSFFDLPPNLTEDESYESLVESNTTNGVVNEFIIPSDKTLISDFKSKFIQYQSRIDALSEPSLSADLNSSLIFVSKSYGVFIPVGERNRVFTIGAGIGISYALGFYSINTCDPYLITGKELP